MMGLLRIASWRYETWAWPRTRPHELDTVKDWEFECPNRRPRIEWWLRYVTLSVPLNKKYIYFSALFFPTFIVEPIIMHHATTRHVTLCVHLWLIDWYRWIGIKIFTRNMEDLIERFFSCSLFAKNSRCVIFAWCWFGFEFFITLLIVPSLSSLIFNRPDRACTLVATADWPFLRADSTGPTPRRTGKSARDKQDHAALSPRGTVGPCQSDDGHCADETRGSQW